MQLLGQFSKALHQAALATGCVIQMQNALLSCPVELADGLTNGFSRFLHIAGGDDFFGLDNESAGASAGNAVIDTPLFVLLVTLDRRFNVSQLLPPNLISITITCERGFYPKAVILSSRKSKPPSRSAAGHFLPGRNFRTSPSRRVTPMASRCSRKARAYRRLVLKWSRNSAAVSDPFASICRITSAFISS